MLHGWVPNTAKCDKCDGDMRLGTSPNYADELSWVCKGEGKRAAKIGKKRRNKCQGRKSIRSGTWLDSFGSNLGRMLLCIYYWFNGTANITIVSKYTGLGYKTVQRLIKCCCLIAANFMVQNQELTKLGGIGKDGRPIKIQIDETFCGKRKYNKGKYNPKTTWVLGGVEDPANLPDGRKLRSFNISVPNQTRATLIPILKYYIEAGSIIWSDGWSSYFNLPAHGYNWDWVNHSQTFKDKVSGVIRIVWKVTGGGLNTAFLKEPDEPILRSTYNCTILNCGPGHTNGTISLIYLVCWGEQVPW